MKRNSKSIKKERTCVRRIMTKSIAIVQEERNQPMENFLQFIETYITHLWSVVLFDDLVICRWFLYTAKAWNLSIAIPDIKCWCFKSLQVKEQTQNREESSDDSNDKKPVEKFELVTVLVGKAGFQRNHLWKGLGIWQRKICTLILSRQLSMPWDIEETFHTKMP